VPSGSRRRLQWPRGLSKHVPPSRRRPHIHIAEPQLVIEALLFFVPTVFSSSARDPARTPLNIVAAAAASAKSPAKNFIPVLRFFIAIRLARPEMCRRFAIGLRWTAVTNRCQSRLLGCAMCGNIAGALPQQNGGVCAPGTPGL
jgi:hypothetical protein